MSKSKGDQREREAREILEEAGWIVETPNYTRYQNTDYFNLFDLMAFKEGEKPLFVQVKSNRPSGIRSFHEDCMDKQVPFDFVDVEFWTCYDREGWRIDSVTREGAEIVLDERESEKNMKEDAIEFKA